MKYQLFDKIINLTFKQVTSTVQGPGDTMINKYGKSYTLTCPAQGQKPTIQVTGQWLPGSVLTECELRITNFIAEKSLLDFGWVDIEAGYAGSLKTRLGGTIMNAYQETPGPDGVTLFQIQTGPYKEWTNSFVHQSWARQTSVNQILRDCAGFLGLTLNTNLPDTMVVQSNLYCTGYVRDFLNTLALAYKIVIRPDIDLLIACMADNDTGIVHEITYVKTPPVREASGWSVICPWDPSIRPFDVVRIKTNYARQTYGGKQVTSTGAPDRLEFTVALVTFDFCTTDDTNYMKLMLIEKGDAVA